MAEPKTWSVAVNRFLQLVILGGILFVAMAQTEYLAAPPAWELVGHSLYRAAFFVTLPFRLLVMVVLPPVHHHYSVAHLAISCFGTPFFLAALWRSFYKVFLTRPASQQPDAEATRPAPDFLGRRQFLVRSGLSVVSTAAGATGGYASFVAPEQLRVRWYQQAIVGLPNALHGLRLVQVSDTHYGPYTSLTYLKYVMDQANSLDGDLVVLTGDYVHLTPDAIPDGIGVLGSLKGRLGRVAVLGNHEHWEGAEACRAEFRRIGIPLLDNGRMFITPDGLEHKPVHGESLCVAGVGDLWTDRVSFSDAFRGVPSDMPRVLLSHNPDVAENIAERYRVDVMLSGHTHGGQVRLPVIGAPWRPSAFGNKYLGGRCSGPRCPVIVSRGVGMAGVPMRFRVPPELCVIELAKANTLLV